MHIKKLILLLFLIPVLAQAQKTTGPNYTYIAQRYEWIAGMFKGLGLPAGDSAQFQTGQELRAGAIYYDSTGIDSGLYVWSGLAWRNYDPATLTASQGITKVGSDFQLGGTITSNRILSTHSGSMRINTNSPDAKYQFFATDTIHNPDLEGNIPFTNFLAQRNLRYPAYSSAYYRVGAQFNLNVEIADSARLNTFGGDFFAANKTTMELKKLAGYTGRSVYMGGDFSTIPESVPIHINDLTLQHSTSTTSNYRYAKGYWAGTKSHLLIGQADTLENWIGFHSAGFTQGTAHVGYTFDFLGGVLGSATEAQVKNPWFLYGFSTRAKSLIAGPTGFGDSTIEASALIDASSTTKGVIWPRMTTVEKDAIASPATGLIVFDTDLVQYNFWDGDSWEAMGGGTTPTLQQVLDAGSTLTSIETISVGTNRLEVSGSITPLKAIASGASPAFNAQHLSSDVSAVADGIELMRSTSGTAANGIGMQLYWNIEAADGSHYRSNRIVSKFTDATARTAQVDIMGLNAGTEETFANIQTGGVVRVNNNADTLATKAYARSVGGGGGGANTALSNLASVAINTSLISDADNADDIGSDAIGWKDVYTRTVKLDGATSGTITLQAAAVAGTNTITLPAATGTVGLLGSTQTWTGTNTFTSAIMATSGINTQSTPTTNSNFTSPTGSSISNTTVVDYQIGGATTTHYKVAFAGNTSPTLLGNAAYAGLMVASVPTTEPASGTSPMNARMAINPQSITEGAGATTDATTFLINGEPTGTATITNRKTALRVEGVSKFVGIINLQGYTVATLPAGVQGDIAYVTDATAPTYLATVTGGGAVVTPVFFDGTNWVAH